MITRTQIQPRPDGHLLLMAWENEAGEKTEFEFLAPTESRAIYQAITEHRDHAITAFGRILDTIGPDIESQPAKAQIIYDQMAEAFFRMDKGQETHFSICEKLPQLKTRILAITPAKSYNRVLAIWRHLANYCQDQTERKDELKWLYQ